MLKEMILSTTVSASINPKSMTQTQSAEEKARLKKQWTDLAIQQVEGMLEFYLSFT